MSHKALFDKLGSPQTLLKVVAEYLESKKLPLDLHCDHICYRVETLGEYQKIKAFLSDISIFKNESLVNHRPISIFQLHTSFEFFGIKTDCIELPAPKENTNYKSGWEHAEFATQESLISFQERYKSLPFDTRALSKTINPELILKVSEICQIKFHEKSILEVIEAERIEQRV